MTAYGWIVPFLGLMVLIVFLFVALQRWTAAKQQQKSAEGFGIWFSGKLPGSEGRLNFLTTSRRRWD